MQCFYRIRHWDMIGIFLQYDLIPKYAWTHCCQSPAGNKRKSDVNSPIYLVAVSFYKMFSLFWIAIVLLLYEFIYGGLNLKRIRYADGSFDSRNKMVTTRTTEGNKESEKKGLNITCKKWKYSFQHWANSRYRNRASTKLPIFRKYFDKGWKIEPKI